MVAFAVTFSDLLEKGGAYAGLAAFFGLAVLAVLYFAQARELKRLRDWAGRAPERAQELEQRVVQQAEQVRRGGVQAQPQGKAQPQQPATAAAKAKPKATPKPAMATSKAPPATASVTPASEAAGAPADSDKTAVNPVAGEHEVVAGKEATAATADQPGEAETGDREPVGATVARAGGAPGEPVVPTAPQAPGQGGPGAPGNGTAGEIPSLPARATPQPPPRRTAPVPAPYRPDTGGTRRVPPPRRTSVYDDPEEPRRRGGILAAGAAAGLILLVVAVIAIFSGGGNDGGGDTTPTTAGTPQTTTTEDPAATAAPDNQPERLVRGDVRVLVYNGTPTSGLAAAVDERVQQAGFASGGEPANYTDSARSASQIFFMSPEFRSAAVELGDVLTVSDIKLADGNLRGLVGSSADVVVVVGADQTP